ncbi:MAG: 4Fe-4S single cluster domain-containing protein [Archangium sp.]
MQLRVAQMVNDTEAEGPGRRFALWVQGCSLRCPGCCNPEMFAADKGGSMLEVEEVVAKILAVPDLEGISVLGGEPFEQPEALAELCARVRAAGLSVMIYTGYTLGELKARPSSEQLLMQVDLLVDGRFEQSKPDTRRRWIGSTNQTMHFLSPRYSQDDARFATPNTVELRFVNGQLTINGWPRAADAFRRR